MGLFDSLAKEVLSKFSSGSGQNPLLESFLNLISNPKTGGLGGLAETFKGKGLGDIVSSWISTGKNLSISKEQILNVLGHDQVQKMADNAGIPKEEATGGLASLLPEIIDKLTPNGKLPESGLLEEAWKMFKKR
jgi:uncharacterized protein YidB (DUF937 family)